MFKQGLVVGKFYPPHKGHKYLIDTAQSQCEKVTVIVCYKQTETIPGTLRAQWLQEIHPGARIILIEDYKLADDDSEGWAAYTKEILGYTPNAVFTSEDYGDLYAKFMGCVHVLVDKERATIPVSGTLVRSDPLQHLNYLEPTVRSYFVKRVCVLGAESTGTTTLARALAEHYQTAWALEYGRYYSEGKLPLGPE
jgi:HTH-type transcriptional repressor of NAD biosynthesis genes